MSVKEEKQQLKVLRECVTQALEKYFANLDGSKPVNLYALVIKEFEAPLLEVALKFADNNQTKVAEILGLSRGTLRKKLKEYKFKLKGE